MKVLGEVLIWIVENCDRFSVGILLIHSVYRAIIEHDFSQGTYWLLWAFIVYYRDTRKEK